MTNLDLLLKQLDRVLGFPNRIGSTVKTTRQFYDQKKGEHVFDLQYRVRVMHGDEAPAPEPSRRLVDSLLP